MGTKSPEQQIKTSGRDVVEYCQLFDYGNNAENLRVVAERNPGYKILDLGAGHANFSSFCHKRGIPVEVYSLDKTYPKNPPSFERIARGTAIGGRMEHLPFKDDTFNEVLASFSFFLELLQQDQLKALQEGLRVLKPGGVLKIHPVFQKPSDQKPLPIGKLIFTYPNDRSRATLVIIKRDIPDKEHLQPLLTQLLSERIFM